MKASMVHHHRPCHRHDSDELSFYHANAQHTAGDARLLPALPSEHPAAATEDAGVGDLHSTRIRPSVDLFMCRAVMIVRVVGWRF